MANDTEIIYAKKIGKGKYSYIGTGSKRAEIVFPEAIPPQSFILRKKETKTRRTAKFLITFVSIILIFIILITALNLAGYVEIIFIKQNPGDLPKPAKERNYEGAPPPSFGDWWIIYNGKGIKDV